MLRTVWPLDLGDRDLIRLWCMFPVLYPSRVCQRPDSVFWSGDKPLPVCWWLNMGLNVESVTLSLFWPLVTFSPFQKGESTWNPWSLLRFELIHYWLQESGRAPFSHVSFISFQWQAWLGLCSFSLDKNNCISLWPNKQTHILFSRDTLGLLQFQDPFY